MPRSWYVKSSLSEKYRHISGCPGCRAKRDRLRKQTHSAECRRRIWAKVEAEPSEIARKEREEARMARHADEAIRREVENNEELRERERIHQQEIEQIKAKKLKTGDHGNQGSASTDQAAHASGGGEDGGCPYQGESSAAKTGDVTSTAATSATSVPSTFAPFAPTTSGASATASATATKGSGTQATPAASESTSRGTKRHKFDQNEASSSSTSAQSPQTGAKRGAEEGREGVGAKVHRT